MHYPKITINKNLTNVMEVFPLEQWSPTPLVVDCYRSVRLFQSEAQCECFYLDMFYV